MPDARFLQPGGDAECWSVERWEADGEEWVPTQICVGAESLPDGTYRLWVNQDGWTRLRAENAVGISEPSNHVYLPELSPMGSLAIVLGVFLLAWTWMGSRR